MSNVTEDPKLESKPCPERKEKRRDKLTDVRRDTEVALKPQHDSQVEEVVEAHKDDKAHDFVVGFLLSGFRTKNPVFVREKEQKVCHDTGSWNRSRV